MPERPHGTVTFLFTDLQGSTRLWDDYPLAMPGAYERHDALLRAVVACQGGVVFKVIGDAFQTAFATAPAAVAAALTAQRQLQAESWTAFGLGEPLRIRMALHTGAVDPDAEGDYRSPVLNRLARLLAAAHGGQIVMSATVQQLIWEALPEGTDLRDLGEHRFKDLDQPGRIYQLLHPDLTEHFPPLRTAAEERRHNLPDQPTGFFGREQDVAAVVALLRGNTVRQVTLTGPGGIGKTRLSLQVAEALLPDFADGVWFVELATITEARLVDAAIAEALGMSEAAADSVRELIHRELSAKAVLLILDNFEQVTSAAPLLNELLLSCPRLKLLVTSRIALHLRAEREFPVAPLTLPRRDSALPLDQLTQFEAVRLFIARAQAVRPDFAVDNVSAPAVAEICHRLDGLPLAIELAAARARLLSPQAMLARLEKRLPLLTGGANDAPDRQRTLRQAIAWSYDLLSPHEQALFRCLAVFAGGFTLEAADAVAAVGVAHDEFDVLEGVERLLDKSLLRSLYEGGAAIRFGMLETIREYGLDQLSQRPDEEGEVFRAHSAFFADLVVAAQRGLATGAADDVARIAAERDNLRVMLDRLLVGGDAEMLLRVVGSLSDYWILTGGRFGEGRTWLERALAKEGDVPPAVRASALTGLAELTIHQGDLSAARAAAAEALLLARAAGDTATVVGALFGLSSANGAAGRFEEAAPLAREAVALAREANDPEWLNWSLYLLGKQSHLAGDLATARTALEESLELARKRGNTWCEADSIAILGLVAGDQGDLARGAKLHAESLTVHLGLGGGIGVPQDLIGLADIALKAGQPEQAAWLLGATAGHHGVFGYALPTAVSRQAEQIGTAARMQIGAERFEAAFASGKMLAPEAVIVQALALAEELTSAGEEPLSA